MSFSPGQLKVKDPADIINAQFDWDTHLASGVVISDFSVVATGSDASVVVDNEALETGDRKVNYTLSGGTARRKYTVMCEITTNEAPPQTLQRSYGLRVEDR